jgi:hypothetical protein
MFVILLLGLTGLLFWGDPGEIRSIRQGWNLGHLIYFGLLTYLLLRIPLISRRTWPVQWSLVLLITLVLGVLIELLQNGTQRTPDLEDVFRDLIGSLLVLVFLTNQWASAKRLAWRFAIKAVVLSLVTLQLYPVSVSLFDETMARLQYPVLADFTTPFQMTRWTGSARRSIEEPTGLEGDAVMQVIFGIERYSGVFLSHFPGDWRGYRRLRLSLFNPADVLLSVTCRIHDRRHRQGMQRYSDRFNERYLLEPGSNELAIELSSVVDAPKKRQLELGQIQKLGLFTTSLKDPKTLYIRKIWLE